MYEVEMKFSLPEVEAFLKSLENLGAKFVETVEETDQFYQHPVRDFAVTDEGLRIRTKKILQQTKICENLDERVGNDYSETKEQDELACCITYKGPKIDIETKTRKEIEIPIASDQDTAQKWNEILLALGFTQSGKVFKVRKTFKLDTADRNYEITLDYLPDLANTQNSCSGYFTEIETQADQAELDSARAAILELAKKLPVAENIRKGYLELLFSN
ncbi:MAG: class IV adenylate cyclase [Thermoguttaceae bacterium]